MQSDCLELFLRYPDFKTKAVTFSYDDGRVQDRIIVEIFNRYRIKATFNLNSGMLSNSDTYVNLDEIKELYQGHEVASHSLSHPHFENLLTGGAAYQIVTDRNHLENILNKPVQGFAFPYGFVEEDNTYEMLKSCGIRYARTTISTHNFGLPDNPLCWNPTCHHSDKALKEIIQRFLSPDDIVHPWRIKLKLLYIWGHSYEFDNRWQELENICAMLSQRRDVWYATNSEIIDYISAYKQIRCSVNGRYIYNPTDKDIYLAVKNKEIIMKSGQTIAL